MKWMLPILAVLALAPLSGRAAAVEPRLQAEGRQVRAFEPSAIVTVPEVARHLGNRRWVLYGYADCDLHLFAENDGAGVVTKLYWIQSEGYIASRPELSHAGDYDASRKIELGGLAFHLDTWVRHAEDAAPAESDLEQVEQLVAASGLALPKDMAFVRLVHLPDPAQRKELMIIYAERPDGADEPSRQEEAALAGMQASIGVRPAATK